MNLFAGQEWRCRCREYTCGHGVGMGRGKGVQTGRLGLTYIYTAMCKTQSYQEAADHAGSSAQHSVMTWKAQEGGSRMYTYGCFTMLYGRTQHNIVKQLHSNYKRKNRMIDTIRLLFTDNFT